MKVLVCGGRFFENWEYFDETLSELDGLVINDDGPSWPAELIKVIIHGGCAGADLLAARWAKEATFESRVVEVLEFKADWDTHGRAAGPIRNQQMLEEGKPDLVLAFAGGRGTDDMCRRAVKAGVEMKRYWPRGKV